MTMTGKYCSEWSNPLSLLGPRTQHAIPLSWCIRQLRPVCRDHLRNASLTKPCGQPSFPRTELCNWSMVP